MINRAVKPTTAKPASGAKAAPKVPVAGIVGGVAPIVVAAPAYADDAIDSAVSSITGAIQGAGGLIKSGATVVSSGIDIAKQGYEAASPIIKQGVDLASPYASKAADAASAALKVATPAVTDAIKNSGVPVKDITATVVTTTKTVSTTATPYVSKIANFISSTEPVVLAEIGIGAAALVLLGPTLLDSLKGYAGDLTAAVAQDKIANEGALMIDIRSAGEKESAGLPDLPSSASSRYTEVEFAATADRKLRGALKDAGALEVQVTALQIASLKRISKGATVIILDKSGGVAKDVAKELARKGFGKVFIVSGGFGGWVSSKLQIKPAAGSASGFGTVGTVFNKKALPAGK